MDFASLACFFALAVTAHNLEEAVWLPRFSRDAKFFGPKVAPSVLRATLLALTLFAWLCVWAARKNDGVATYVLCGYALAMLLNVALPHLALTLALRRYAPGLATALLFDLPASLLLLRAALHEERIALATFAWAGPTTVAAIVAAIALCFAVGSRSRRA